MYCTVLYILDGDCIGDWRSAVEGSSTDSEIAHCVNNEKFKRLAARERKESVPPKREIRPTYTTLQTILYTVLYSIRRVTYSTVQYVRLSELMLSYY